MRAPASCARAGRARGRGLAGEAARSADAASVPLRSVVVVLRSCSLAQAVAALPAPQLFVPSRRWAPALLLRGPLAPAPSASLRYAFGRGPASGASPGIAGAPHAPGSLPAAWIARSSSRCATSHALAHRVQFSGQVAVGARRLGDRPAPSPSRRPAAPWHGPTPGRLLGPAMLLRVRWFRSGSWVRPSLR